MLGAMTRIIPHRHAFLFTLALLAPLSPALASYQVVRDVNDPKPAEVAQVIFEQGQGIDHLTFTADEGTSAELLDDGRLRIRLEGPEWKNIFIRWSEDSGVPATLNLDNFRDLVIRGHLEGFARVPRSRRDDTLVEADIADQPVAFVFFTLEEGWVSGGRIEGVMPDGKNPTETTDIVFPIPYFIPGRDQDLSQANGLALRMVGRPGQERQYDLIVEKIYLTK